MWSLQQLGESREHNLRPSAMKVFAKKRNLLFYFSNDYIKIIAFYSVGYFLSRASFFC